MNPINLIYTFFNLFCRLTKLFVLIITSVLFFLHDSKATQTLSFKNFEQEFGLTPADISGGWTSPDLGVYTGLWEFAGFQIQLNSNGNLRAQGNGNHIIDPDGTFTITILDTSDNLDNDIDITFDAGTTELSAGESYSVDNGSFTNVAGMNDSSNWYITGTPPGGAGPSDLYDGNKVFATDGGVVATTTTVTNTALTFGLVGLEVLQHGQGHYPEENL